MQGRETDLVIRLSRCAPGALSDGRAPGNGEGFDFHVNGGTDVGAPRQVRVGCIDRL